MSRQAGQSAWELSGHLFLDPICFSIVEIFIFCIFHEINQHTILTYFYITKILVAKDSQFVILTTISKNIFCLSDSYQVQKVFSPCCMSRFVILINRSSNQDDKSGFVPLIWNQDDKSQICSIFVIQNKPGWQKSYLVHFCHPKLIRMTKVIPSPFLSSKINQDDKIYVSHILRNMKKFSLKVFLYSLTNFWWQNRASRPFVPDKVRETKKYKNLIRLEGQDVHWLELYNLKQLKINMWQYSCDTDSGNCTLCIFRRSAFELFIPYYCFHKHSSCGDTGSGSCGWWCHMVPHKEKTKNHV